MYITSVLNLNLRVTTAKLKHSAIAEHSSKNQFRLRYAINTVVKSNSRLCTLLFKALNTLFSSTQSNDKLM